MVTASESGATEESASAPQQIIEALNDLLRLDHDAVGAYEVAIQHLENREHALRIEAFKQDHERHIHDLNELILELGGEPENEPHATAPLKQGIQRIGATRGDRGILLAWRANQLQITTKYDRYAHAAVGWPPRVKALIDRNALDEERHYAWVATFFGDADPAEIGAATRAREGLTQARVAGRNARKRAGGLADTARERTAEGLAHAAASLDRLAVREAGAEGVRGRAAEGARHAARGLDAASALLRDGSELEPREAVEHEIRRNPVRSLLVTFGLGFVLGRIIR